jgi:hypothetical protein
MSKNDALRLLRQRPQDLDGTSCPLIKLLPNEGLVQIMANQLHGLPIFSFPDPEEFRLVISCEPSLDTLKLIGSRLAYTIDESEFYRALVFEALLPSSYLAEAPAKNLLKLFRLYETDLIEQAAQIPVGSKFGPVTCCGLSLDGLFLFRRPKRAG